MLTGRPADISSGGACAFQLARDSSAASHARSLLAATMRELRFTIDSIEDAKLAVSELATNAYKHAASTAPPELWVWAHTCPAPELVISIFDANREIWPVMRNTDPLDEHGKGLSIVVALSTGTGTYLTRSRLTTSAGKCVWFTVALPSPWPAADRVIAPETAASRLTEILQARGIPTKRCSDDSGISLLTAGTLNIWAEPKSFSWRDGQDYFRRPLIDLQETAERIVSHHEASRPSTSSP